MGPAWQAKLQASSKASVEKEERAARQAKLQQALKENLNILFFDKVTLSCFTCFTLLLTPLLQNDEPGRQLALQGSEDIPDFPWVKPDEFIHRFGPDITAVDHRTAIGRWVELARLDIVYKVANNDTLIFRRRGVHRMPGIDDEVGQIRHPPPPAHFFKSMSSQRTQVRKEKKAREESRAAPVSGQVSAFPSVPPRPSTPAFDNDGRSSDIEVSEIMDNHNLMKRAHDGEVSHPDARTHKRVKPSVRAGRLSFASRLPSPTTIDSWAPFTHEEPLYTYPGALSSANSTSTTIDSWAPFAPEEPLYSNPGAPSSANSTSTTIDSWAPFAPEEPLYTNPGASSSANSTSPPSSPLWFPDSSMSPSAEQPSYRATPSPPSSFEQSPLLSMPSLSPSRSPPRSVPKKDLPWHHGLYCTDVVDGLERMDSRSLKGLSKADRFAIAFPHRRFADSTVRDAQTQWARASDSAKEAALAAGKTTQGLWRVFSAQHPIKTRKSKGRRNQG